MWRRRIPACSPGIVKSARFGYDGKGQARVRRSRDDARRHGRRCTRTPACSNSSCRSRCEVSVIVARNDRGETATWPVAENQHRDGILDTSVVPARVPAPLADGARDIATRVAAALDYRGVLCVEMFVTRDGTLLVNEIAPRPHNSGHYSIDACVTSQFEQQARVLAGLPLGATRQHTPAVMVNLLGDLWFPADSHRRRARAALGSRAAASGGEAPPLRQGRAAPRPQDGARDVSRRHARRRPRDRGRRESVARHPGGESD